MKMQITVKDLYFWINFQYKDIKMFAYFPMFLTCSISRLKKKQWNLEIQKRLRLTDPVHPSGGSGGGGGGGRGGREGRPPGPKFLHFHAVFGKHWSNKRLAPPPLGLAPPPLGNPGSATASSTSSSSNEQESRFIQDFQGADPSGRH